jgi:Zn-dependent protease/predicted transcriptional regulator
MDWSFSIARIKGINIKIHYTFFLILLWGAFSLGSGNSLLGLAYGALLTIILFVFVTLHELGHSLVALRFGIRVRDITLMPLGGVAQLERMPEKSLQELLIASAGPLVNVALAIVALPLAVAVLGWQALNTGIFSTTIFNQAGIPGIIWFTLTANISLAVFNLIPAFPLDGGRVLRAVLAFFMNYLQATHLAVNIGRGLALLMGLAGIVMGNMVLAIIAFFIFNAGTVEEQTVRLRTMLRVITVGEIMPKNLVLVYAWNTVGEARSWLAASLQPYFAVVDEQGLAGVVSRTQLQEALAKGQVGQGIAELMRRDVLNVHYNEPLDEVQRKMANNRIPFAIVNDGLRFLGIISIEDINRSLTKLVRSMGHGSI